MTKELCIDNIHVFKEIGKFKQPYKIELEDEACPYVVKSPRSVAVSLYDKLKEEIDRLIKEEVIQPISEPTDWCSPIVIMPRSGGGIRLCVDYTKLKQYFKQDMLQLPTGEESLAKLEGGFYFSKLDVANRFWQIPLNPISHNNFYNFFWPILFQEITLQNMMWS